MCAGTLVELYSILTGELYLSIKETGAITLQKLAVSPDHKYMIVSSDGHSYQFCMKTGEKIRDYDLDGLGGEFIGFGEGGLTWFRNKNSKVDEYDLESGSRVGNVVEMVWHSKHESGRWVKEVVGGYKNVRRNKSFVLLSVPPKGRGGYGFEKQGYGGRNTQPRNILIVDSRTGRLIRNVDVEIYGIVMD